MDLFARLRSGLSKTREALVSYMQEAAGSGAAIDEVYDQVEEGLVACDVGVRAAGRIVAEVRSRVRTTGMKDAAGIRAVLRTVVRGALKPHEGRLDLPRDLAVIMVVGVNGVGKTTTIAKLAWLLRSQGRKVMLAASDTFRAAAVEQLEVWSGRVGAGIVRHREGGDPAAVAFDAVQAARSRGMDTVIVDTAGRLHTKTNLMEELKKVRRVLAREVEGAPHEVLLVLDSTTGQNALEQAKVFKESVGATGIVLTKLDGTAKGGIIIAIAEETGIPLKFVGVGEGMEDLRDFSADAFAEALL